MNRSARADVRNPLLALPAAAAIARLPTETRAALRLLLLDIRQDALARAEKCWRQRKAPMAAYWKAVSVYAGHAARVCRRHFNRRHGRVARMTPAKRVAIALRVLEALRVNVPEGGRYSGSMAPNFQSLADVLTLPDALLEQQLAALPLNYHPLADEVELLRCAWSGDLS
jgi:hypothetical protein